MIAYGTGWVWTGRLNTNLVLAERMSFSRLLCHWGCWDKKVISSIEFSLLLLKNKRAAGTKIYFLSRGSTWLVVSGEHFHLIQRILHIASEVEIIKK